MRLLTSFLLASWFSSKPAPAPAPAPETASPVAATTKTFTVTEADLVAYIQKRPKLARGYYDLRRGALEELVLDRLVDDASKKAGVSSEVWLQQEVTKRVQPPSEVEIKAFFMSRIAPENPSAELTAEAPRIRAYLMEDRSREAVHKIVSDLREAAAFQIKLAPVRIPIATTGPSMGPVGAPLTLVEFSDYQCPYCQRQEQAIKEILKAYPTQLRLVVRDFPLEMHPYARPAARAAVCADLQGHFWPMHDRLFEDASALDDEGLLRSAKAIGLDGDKFSKCLADPATERKVADSQRDGEEAGVDGTPALFLNGRPFPGAVTFADLKAVVDEELAAVAPNQPAAKPAGKP